MRLPTTANFLLHALDVVALVVALSMAIAGARMVAAAPSEIERSATSTTAGSGSGTEIHPLSRRHSDATTAAFHVLSDELFARGKGQQPSQEDILAGVLGARSEEDAGRLYHGE